MTERKFIMLMQQKLNGNKPTILKHVKNEYIYEDRQAEVIKILNKVISELILGSEELKIDNFFTGSFENDELEPIINILLHSKENNCIYVSATETLFTFEDIFNNFPNFTISDIQEYVVSLIISMLLSVCKIDIV